MNFLEWLIPSKARQTGYIVDSEEYTSQLPKHELFASGVAGEYPNWRNLAPNFRFQESTMMCTAFAGASAAAMLNKYETKQDVSLSPLELFCRAQGSTYGNTIEATERAMKEGLALESSCPWIGPVTDWNPFVLKLMGAYAKGKPLNPEYAVRGFTRVMTDPTSLAHALKDSPLVVTLFVNWGYWNAVAPAATSGSMHAVVLTQIMADGRMEIFDSLQPKSGFDGFHYLASNFPLISAFGVLDLPNNWKEQQDASISAKYPIAFGRYGRSKDVNKESNAIIALKAARAKNPTHLTYIDDAWDLYVLAIAYGGYSVQDVLNSISSVRRGKKHLFDFNQPRV